MCIAAAVVALVLLAMYAYTGQWPPLVVIESDSMMHGDENHSHIGTIDTGDLVLVQKVDSIADVVTYTEGYVSGHRTYGDYGDVIVYEPDGSEIATPIIHRAMIYLEVNDDESSYRSDSLRALSASKWSTSNPTDTWDHITGAIYIYHVGYKDRVVVIDTDSLGFPLRSGFITKGDHNDAIDQPGRSDNVELSWIVGKARGEIPWFGLLKLWSTHTLKSAAPANSVTNLWICLGLMILAPIIIDVGLTYREKKRLAGKKSSEQKKGEKGPSDKISEENERG